KHGLHISRTRAQATLALPAAVPVEELPPVVAPVPQALPAEAPPPPRKAAPKPVALAPPPAPAPAPVTFAEAFHAAAVTHQDEVQACYARLEHDLARRLHVVLSIQPTGAVAPPVQVEEPGVDPAFVDCVNGAARSWS